MRQPEIFTVSVTEAFRYDKDTSALGPAFRREHPPVKGSFVIWNLPPTHFLPPKGEKLEDGNSPLPVTGEVNKNPAAVVRRVTPAELIFFPPNSQTTKFPRGLNSVGILPFSVLFSLPFPRREFLQNLNGLSAFFVDCRKEMFIAKYVPFLFVFGFLRCRFAAGRLWTVSDGRRWQRFSVYWRFLAGEVYMSDLTALITWTCERCGGKIQEFEIIELIVDVQYCLQAFVGVAQDPNAIIIAFRGTQEHRHNWIEDLFWKQLDLNYPGVSDAMVHHGFYSAYHNTTVRTGVLNAVQKAKNFFGDLPIIVTGHSMGGAMASFCALDLTVNQGEKEVQVMTFGQPRIGNSAFSTYFSKHVPNAIRITHGHDMVPHLPPYYSYFPQKTYHHFPREVWLYSIGLGSLVYKVEKLCDDSGEDASCSRHASLFPQQYFSGNALSKACIVAFVCNWERHCTTHSTLHVWFLTITAFTEVLDVMDLDMLLDLKQEERFRANQRQPRQELGRVSIRQALVASPAPTLVNVSGRHVVQRRPLISNLLEGPYAYCRCDGFSSEREKTAMVRGRRISRPRLISRAPPRQRLRLSRPRSGAPSSLPISPDGSSSDVSATISCSGKPNSRPRSDSLLPPSLLLSSDVSSPSLFVNPSLSLCFSLSLSLSLSPADLSPVRISHPPSLPFSHPLSRSFPLNLPLFPSLFPSSSHPPSLSLFPPPSPSVSLSLSLPSHPPSVSPSVSNVWL
ncbi:hypothetical protein ACLOJK_026067 [Asimina triloba]